MNKVFKHQLGFTLVELMVVLIIIGILAVIALPSYQEYQRRQRLAVAKQEMQNIAGELERFKSKNFSYKGFDTRVFYPNTSSGTLQVPVDKASKTYTITLVDLDEKKPLNDSDAVGLGWAMIAVRNGTPVDHNNYDLLIRSDGTRCQTKESGKVNDGQYADCGSNAEAW